MKSVLDLGFRDERSEVELVCTTLSYPRSQRTGFRGPFQELVIVVVSCDERDPTGLPGIDSRILGKVDLQRISRTRPGTAGDFDFADTFDEETFSSALISNDNNFRKR